MASAGGPKSGRKSARSVVLHNDSRKLEVKPGIRGGTFFLPQVDWASQTGRIEVSPNLFGRKDRLSCTVFEPWERHGKTPPFSRASDHLLSEVYLFAVTHGPSTATALETPAHIHIPYYMPLATEFNHLALKLMTKTKWDEQWKAIPNSLFDNIRFLCDYEAWAFVDGSDEFPFCTQHENKMAMCTVPPVGYFAVLGCLKMETFEVNPNGCTHSAQLNHYVSLRFAKACITRNILCSLRIVPISPHKLKQVRQDYQRETAEIQFISDIYEFDADVEAELYGNDSVTANSGQSPAASADTTTLFKRPITLKLPIPPWYNAHRHPVKCLALFYRLRGNTNWGYFTTPVQLEPQLMTVSIEVPFLAHFALGLTRDPSRSPLVGSAVMRIEDYTNTFRGTIHSFVQFNRESKKWNIRVHWLNSKDGENLIADPRVNRLYDTLSRANWTPLTREGVKVDEAGKHVAWADGSEQDATETAGASGNGESILNIVNKRQKQRVQLAKEAVPPSLCDGSLISMTVAQDMAILSTVTDTVSFGVYEELPDYSIYVTLQCRLSSKVEPRIRSYVSDLARFYSGESSEFPTVPPCVGEVRCSLMQTLDSQRLALSVFRFSASLDDILMHLNIRKPEPPDPNALNDQGDDQDAGLLDDASLNKSGRRKLDRPRRAPPLIPLNDGESIKELRVLSGRSLQVLARQIEQGVMLAAFLNLQDSVISAITLDSIALHNKTGSSNVTYRVLIAWKRMLQLHKHSREREDSAVEQLISALNQLGREDLAELVQAAHSQNKELRIPIPRVPLNHT